ncbi:single-stranded DNA-binding protein (plasmid) [Phormidium sp. CLA17]|uniref:single-stranded DNA-binding protein n=1 Tax=Leptolyngbya sp. Cla-17 TaxID=2803751 RepID=UPI00149101B3|nr:single-stranded DNA-binding protein [Leptolyngbya sp. Cla-17]
MNNIFLTGTLIRAELRHTPQDQTPICEFDLEFQFERRDAVVRETVAVTAWNELGTEVYNQFSVGSRVLVEGLTQIELVPVAENRTIPRLSIRALRVQSASPEQSLNSVMLVGYVGSDPDRKDQESGNVVANLSLAINRPKVEEPDWYSLELWNKRAEVAMNYVRKGSLIGVTGALKIDRWTDKATQLPRTKPVIRVDRLELLGGKRETGSEETEAVPDVETQTPEVAPNRKRKATKASAA